MLAERHSQRLHIFASLMDIIFAFAPKDIFLILLRPYPIFASIFRALQAGWITVQKLRGCVCGEV
jgi:hypothetical protein